LVALARDVILAITGAAVAQLVETTRTVPIVFAIVADPVGAGYVDSLARPGGNITGFTSFEYSMSGKWLQLLKEIAPERNASGGFSRSFHNGRTRAVRGDPSPCTIA
jgi:putative ABC transport system substrate-binding protein